jgi:DNA (cytosine-5)-methyltransferase 1
MDTTVEAQMPLLENEMSDRFRLSDMFAGCGGMTLGFVNAMRREGEFPRFIPVWAVDNDEKVFETYRANFDSEGEHSVCSDIEEMFEGDPPELPDANVVIGGPPCQGFSLLNKKKEKDNRRKLWWYFLEGVRLSGADVMVMENVPPLLSSSEFDKIRSRLDELGFDHLAAHVLTAADYGVPQKRDRAIVMASKKSPISLPRPTHLNPGRLEELGDEINRDFEPWRTVEDAIGDLEPLPEETRIQPDEDPPNDLHVRRNPTDKSIERYKAVPPGGNRFDLEENRPDITPDCWKRKDSGGTDLFGRLWWDRPSVTIRTEFYKPEKGRYLHPEEHRAITLREGARLQSFPDDFEFRGTARVHVGRQIGNAVPPLLAEAIAEEVFQCLKVETTKAYVRETERMFEMLLDENVMMEEL